MKIRIITGIVGALLTISALIFISTPYLGILISFFSFLAVFEIERVAQVTNKPIIVLSVLFAGAVPTFVEYDLLEKLHLPLQAVLVVYVIVLLILMLIKYDNTRFEHVTMAFFSSLAVPFALSSLILLRDVYVQYAGRFEKWHGFYLVIFVLTCSWLTDTFAYFVGVNFGKHKLCPKISPKKTVEGAVGGIVLTAVFNLIILLIFNKFFFITELLPLWAIIPISVLLSVVSMLGDLSASTIKRNYGIKDFGKLFPGHGGVMDRFDSVIFVAPVIYAVVMLSQALNL